MEPEYNSQIHHRRSIRLQDYDYSQDGYYYITICTKNFVKYFGQIKNGKMELSKIGHIVCDEWIKVCRGVCNTPLQTNNRFRSPSNNLGAIIRSFKSSVKRQCNKNNFPHFQWHRNYYEHIIRDEIELYIKRKYIINNPLKWHLDKNN